MVWIHHLCSDYGHCFGWGVFTGVADAGLLDAVEAYVATQPRAVQLEWEYASEIRRDNALLSTAATALGMTSEQLQALFTQAATL